MKPSYPLMKTLLKLAVAAVLTMPAFAETVSPAEQLGFKLAVHSYTFQKFSLLDAIEKTGALGVKYMSVSGNVNLASGDATLVKTPTVNSARGMLNQICRLHQ